MKSKSILFVLLLYGLYAHAQTSAERRVRFGVKAGVNGSLFMKTVEPFGGPDRSNLEYFNRFYRASGFGGLTADAGITGRFMLGTELLFNSRGMAYREENNSVIITDEDGEDQQAYNYFNYNIDYMEFPITILYNFNRLSSNTWLAGYAGMAPAIAVNYKTKLRYEKSTGGSEKTSRDKKEILKSVNHFNNSLLVGLKVGDNRSGKVNPYGDFRLSYTLLPVFNRAVSENGNNLDTQMLTLSLGFGVRF